MLNNQDINSNMKNIKTKVTFSLLVCLVSCDISTRLQVNGSPEHCIVNDCGDIIIAGMAFEPDRISFVCDGNFCIYGDSLKLKKNGLNVPISTINFYLNNDKYKDWHRISINGKNKLEIHISQDPSLNYGKTGFIELLPSDFIQCNGKPVITDTIHFACKSKEISGDGSF